MAQTLAMSAELESVSSGNSSPANSSPCLSPSSSISSLSDLYSPDRHGDEGESWNDHTPLDNPDTFDSYVMVVGGLGYIGSHTTLELLKAGYNVVVVDNLSNSHESAFKRICGLAAKHWKIRGGSCPRAKLYKLDYRSPSMRTVLGRYVVEDKAVRNGTCSSSIIGVIHFAAYKSVEESIRKPLDYYLNNVAGLIEFVELLELFGIQNFVFSSSATVYGETLNRGIPLKETDLVHHATAIRSDDGQPVKVIPGTYGHTSPYGKSKYFCESILADVANADPSWRITALRYFNPVGCEPSGQLGENPRQTPTNLFPVVAQVLTGRREVLDVYGTDWDTEDGTAMRDFIHVVDLAKGHIAALKTAALRPDAQAFRAYNLGTGRGSTVANVIQALEQASTQSIPVRRVGRRAGDVGCCVAVTERAADELGWRAEHGLTDCAADTWRCLQMEMER